MKQKPNADVRNARTPTTPMRSHIMRSVPRERTEPELVVGKFLSTHGIRFRSNARSLPGTPDIANKSRKFAVYVHGCFWHRHRGCRRATTPKDNAEFWLNKFQQNVERDARKESELRSLGFEVAVVWECEVYDEKRLSRALARVLKRAKQAR